MRRKARPRGRQAQSASARCGAGSVSPRPPSLRIAPMLPTADSYAAKIEMRVDRRTAMTLTACFSFQEAPVGKSHNMSVWHKLLGIVTDGPTPTTEDAIAAYLHHHQHDLPPALWIELERRRLIP